MTRWQDIEPLAGKRVLVTGGFGFVGSNLVHACVELGAEVAVLDSQHADSGANLANLAGVRDSIEIFDGDIRDTGLSERAIAGCDLVFHCAALTSHSHSMTAPRETVEVNVLGTLTLLEAMRTHSPDARFIYIGTSSQVGRMRIDPIDEDHPEFPLDVYAATKTGAEKLVLLYASAHGLKTSVVRLANLYGPRSHVRSPKFGFIGFFIGLGLQGAPITVFGDGEQLRTVTFIDDAVCALLMVAQSDASIGEALFAVADDQLSVAEIATAISKNVGGHLELVPWPEGKEKIEVGDAVVSSQRIKERLGWRARVGLEDGLQATVDYYQDRAGDYLS